MFLLLFVGNVVIRPYAPQAVAFCAVWPHFGSIDIVAKTEQETSSEGMQVWFCVSCDQQEQLHCEHSASHVLRMQSAACTACMPGWSASAAREPTTRDPLTNAGALTFWSSSQG